MSYIHLMDRDGIAELLRKTDELSYIDVIDMITTGSGDIEFFSPPSGIIVRHRCGTRFIAVLGPEREELLRHIEPYGLYSVHDDETAAYMKEKLGYEGDTPCYLLSWRGGRVDNEKPFSIKTLSSDCVPFVMEHYSTSSEDDIREAAESGKLYGAFSSDGSIMGFAGFHSEGSMGLLTVLPEYRRNGIGEALEIHLINTAIGEGRIPYCNVFVDNAPSLHLQDKLGLERGGILSWWIWRDRP